MSGKAFYNNDGRQVGTGQFIAIKKTIFNVSNQKPTGGTYISDTKTFLNWDVVDNKTEEKVQNGYTENGLLTTLMDVKGILRIWLSGKFYDFNNDWLAKYHRVNILLSDGTGSPHRSFIGIEKYSDRIKIRKTMTSDFSYHGGVTVTVEYY